MVGPEGAAPTSCILAVRDLCPKAVCTKCGNYRRRRAAELERTAAYGEPDRQVRIPYLFGPLPILGDNTFSVAFRGRFFQSSLCLPSPASERSAGRAGLWKG
jgi:hypothetical protein